jgi:uncharacterized protein YggE
MNRLAIITLAGVLAAGLAAGAAEESGPESTITATGTAEVKGLPDTAEVDLAVVTQGFSADSAVRDNRRRVGDVLRRLEEHGVRSKDAQLGAPQVYPQLDQSFSDVGEREISGYLACGKVRVKVRRLDRIGRVIDEATGAGARLDGDITYAISDASSRMAEARRKAVQDARRKAEEDAKAAGMELGEVLQIRDEKPGGSESHDSYGQSASPKEQKFRVKVAVTFAAGKPTRGVETKSPPSEKNR